MKQVIKIRDIVKQRSHSVVHSDSVDDIELTKNPIRPELVNINIGDTAFVVELSDLKKAIEEMEK